MLISGRLILNPAEPPKPGWIRVDGDRIVEVGAGDRGDADLGSADHLVCPGFVDAHLHLPQIDSIGCDGLELLDWLDRVIYPAESAWSDQRTADDQAWRAYGRLLRAGTLGFAAFLTAHRQSVVAAIRAGHRLPLRGIAGQVLMDREAPASLLDQPTARLARSRQGRLACSLNPRFAVACTPELLSTTGTRIEPDTIIHTHLAETPAECRRVAELFPGEEHYVDVYDRFGLLTPRTLLAHGVHLDEHSWSVIAERDAVVVHCPIANAFLGAGLFDLAAARRHGVRLALGSDVAAGSCFDMPTVARSMIDIARLRRASVDPDAAVPRPAEVWDLITRGNADALGWTDGGRIEPGAAADVLVLRVPFEIDDYLIGRLLYTWSDRYIESRVVNGVIRDLSTILP